MLWFWVALGGALGSAARFLAVTRLHPAFPGVFPYGTLAVNLAGSAVIGILWGLFESVTLSPAVSGQARAFLMTGILGGFTTFSTFSLENVNLVRAGEWRLALLYVLLSNVLGIGLALAGFGAVRAALRAG